VAEIKAAGGEAVASYASVAEYAQAESIIKTAMDTWGRLDILVNNAGILRDKSFNKMTMEDFEFVMQVHLMGTVYCTKAAWQIMRDAKYGRIVVTTSGSGTVGNFGQANYGAAKMAVNGFINVLRHEGQNYNIKTNAISPSARTRMTENLIPAEVAEWMKPELVSPAVAYMCSEQCDFSGEIIGANAGHFRRVRYFESEGQYFDPAEPVTVDMFAEALPKIMDLSHPIEHGMSSRRLRERLVAMGRIPA
jgi:NAD(P)-dependent dehydrogenase (short-subunit alcohol dehydrogenase family)